MSTPHNVKLCYWNAVAKTLEVHHWDNDIPVIQTFKPDFLHLDKNLQALAIEILDRIFAAAAIDNLSGGGAGCELINDLRCRVDFDIQLSTPIGKYTVKTMLVKTQCLTEKELPNECFPWKCDQHHH
jgi:hypothetical protein